MNLTNQTVVLFVLALTTFMLLIGCGGTPKPSASVVSKLVKENLSKGMPASWVNARFWTTQATIKTVKIEEWGKFNEDIKYWPAKIRVVGTAKAEMGFLSLKIVILMSLLNLYSIKMISENGSVLGND